MLIEFHSHIQGKGKYPLKTSPIQVKNYSCLQTNDPISSNSLAEGTVSEKAPSDSETGLCFKDSCHGEQDVCSQQEKIVCTCWLGLQHLIRGGSKPKG